MLCVHIQPNEQIFFSLRWYYAIRQQFLLKTESLDNAIRKFSVTMLYKYDKCTGDFLGCFYFYFSLVFYILGAVLIKQLLYSSLLDIANYVQREIIVNQSMISSQYN